MLWVSFPHSFQAWIKLFFPICIRKSINISTYLGRYLNFRKFKYEPKHINILLLLLTAWHVWITNALKVEATIKTSYAHSNQKQCLTSVRLVGLLCSLDGENTCDMLFLKWGSYWFTSINMYKFCAFLYLEWFAYMFFILEPEHF